MIFTCVSFSFLLLPLSFQLCLVLVACNVCFLFSCLGYVLLNAFVLIIDVFDFWNLIHTFIIMFLWLLLHVYFSLEQHLTDEKSRRHKSSLHKIRAAPGVRRPWLHHEAWLRRWDEKKTLSPKNIMKWWKDDNERKHWQICWEEFPGSGRNYGQLSKTIYIYYSLTLKYIVGYSTESNFIKCYIWVF